MSGLHLILPAEMAMLFADPGGNGRGPEET
jgi:hypothetical protein